MLEHGPRAARVFLSRDAFAPFVSETIARSSSAGVGVALNRCDVNEAEKIGKMESGQRNSLAVAEAEVEETRPKGSNQKYGMVRSLSPRSIASR